MILDALALAASAVLLALALEIRAGGLRLFPPADDWAAVEARNRRLALRRLLAEAQKAEARATIDARRRRDRQAA